VSEQQAGQVTLRPDVVFGTGGDRDLCCDVYLPPQEAGRRPGVLLVHGGAWKLGSRQQLKGYGFLIGRQGFVCVASEYRLSEEAAWPAQLHDVKAAIRWMRATADELGLDPDRIAVMGASSGGQLALVAAETAGEPEWEGAGGNPEAASTVAAVVAFYAPTRLDRDGPMLREFIDLLMGDDVSDQGYRCASPVELLRPGHPPTLIFHSNRDDIVPRQQSLTLYDRLVQLGVPVELHLYDGEPHAFDARPELGREAANLVASFLNRHLPKPT
jgi:acetyl esterase/lipase